MVEYCYELVCLRVYLHVCLPIFTKFLCMYGRRDRFSSGGVAILLMTSYLHIVDTGMSILLQRVTSLRRRAQDFYAVLVE